MHKYVRKAKNISQPEKHLDQSFYKARTKNNDLLSIALVHFVSLKANSRSNQSSRKNPINDEVHRVNQIPASPNKFPPYKLIAHKETFNTPTSVQQRQLPYLTLSSFSPPPPFMFISPSQRRGFSFFPPQDIPRRCSTCPPAEIRKLAPR